jgi:hypothetical protein
MRRRLLLLLLLMLWCPLASAAPVETRITNLNKYIQECYTKKDFAHADQAFDAVENLIHQTGDFQTEAKTALNHAQLLNQMGKFDSAMQVTKTNYLRLVSLKQQDLEMVTLEQKLKLTNAEAARHLRYVNYLMQNPSTASDLQPSSIRYRSTVLQNHWENQSDAMETVSRLQASLDNDLSKESPAFRQKFQEQQDAIDLRYRKEAERGMARASR